MTTLIAFIVVIVLLVLVHEFGHFWAAKKSGLRVDEFGVGFPPRIWGIKKGETFYSINAIPFGGFVKIHGENESESESDTKRSFAHAGPYKQAIVLLAGVSLNFIFAWLLISVGFIAGQPVPASFDERVENPVLMVTEVLPNSPAFESGFLPGDVIEALQVSSQNIESVSPEIIQDAVSVHKETEILFTVRRAGEELTISTAPQEGLVEEGSHSIGIAMGIIGTLKLPIHEAFYEGAKVTLDMSQAIVEGFLLLFRQIFLGTASSDVLTGPVGIASLAGSALRTGFVEFISFTAIISIHLAILNLLPIPALDGGRLLFVIIETITRKKIPTSVVAYVNAAFFFLLIGLMLFVTYKDILKLF